MTKKYTKVCVFFEQDHAKAIKILDKISRIHQLLKARFMTDFCL